MLLKREAKRDQVVKDRVILDEKPARAKAGFTAGNSMTPLNIVQLVAANYKFTCDNVRSPSSTLQWCTFKVALLFLANAK